MLNWKEVPQLPKAQGRIEAIDLARGIAIGLMIISHAVSGLVGMRHVPMGHGAYPLLDEVLVLAIYFSFRHCAGGGLPCLHAK